MIPTIRRKYKLRENFHLSIATKSM